MSNEDWETSVGILLTDPETGDDFPHLLSLPVFWGWYTVIVSQGIDQALEMAAFAGALVRHDLVDKRDGGTFVKGGLPQEERAYLRRMLECLKDMGDRNKDKETHALQISYEVLGRKDWTRKQAARFASNVLGREISTDTWRKRVDRWAQRQGKPKVEAYKLSTPK